MIGNAMRNTMCIKLVSLPKINRQNIHHLTSIEPGEPLCEANRQLHLSPRLAVEQLGPTGSINHHDDIIIQ